MSRSFAARRGFTLIELLVVTIVIAILVSIITIAAYAAIKAARNTAIHQEIKGISGAIEYYKTTHGAYPPNFDNQQRVIAHANMAFAQRRASAAQPPTGLDPAQALVYWLSGVSNDPKDPFKDPASSQQRAKPLFEFDQTRLELDDKYPEYYPAKVDKVPYIYYHSASYKYFQQTPYQGLRPYEFDQDKGGGFCQRDGFQIIAAGLDNDLGTGGRYPSGAGYSDADYDNIVNFSAGKVLGDDVP